MPALVSWAVPKTAAPSHCTAVASQKMTSPAVTGEVTGPTLIVLVTVAIKVIAVPAGTLLGDTDSVVVEVTPAPFARSANKQIVATRSGAKATTFLIFATMFFGTPSSANTLRLHDRIRRRHFGAQGIYLVIGLRLESISDLSSG